MDASAVPEPRGRWLSSSVISVALLAGVGFLPLVVAVGFLTDRVPVPPVPSDIAISHLRGPLDEAPTGGRNPSSVARAAF